LKVKYLGLKQEYDHLKKNYDAQVVFINKDSVTYEKQVEAWNMGDRNSREQFKELNLKKSNLEEGVEALKLLESQLNVMVRDINTVAGRLNSLARTLNLKVETYNTVGVSRGETYTGGLYQNTSSAEIINIYEFSNSDKLVKVLTHELGHALGFEHVSDPQAMMYYLNEGEASHLSESDLTILHTLCGVK
jgi:hypothetical protein